jgi:uncharacterized RDD family membrane protein YckC
MEPKYSVSDSAPTARSSTSVREQFRPAVEDSVAKRPPLEALKQRVHPSLGPSPGIELVSFADRLTSSVIDVGLILAGSLFVFAVSRLESFQELLSEHGDFALLGVILLGSWIYFAGLMAAPTQGSVGMLFSNSRVSTLSGDRIGFVRASWRFCVMAVSVLVVPAMVVSVLLTLKFERKQGIHDMAARTLVVRRATPLHGS